MHDHDSMAKIQALEDVRLSAEADAIRIALRNHKGNVTHAARELGTTYRSLRRRLIRLSIDRSDFLPAPEPCETSNPA